MDTISRGNRNKQTEVLEQREPPSFLDGIVIVKYVTYIGSTKNGKGV